MSRKFLFVGVIGGLGVAMVLAVFFSGAATAQMMQHQQMQHSPGMKHSMFKAIGISMVQDVSVTGVATTDDDTISVSLAYNGTGSAPSVTVIAVTNHEHIMNMIGSSSSMGGMMMGSNMMGMNSMGTMAGHGMTGNQNTPGWQHPDMPSWNSTQWQNWHSQMTAQINSQPWQMQSQSGSTVLEGGWQSGENAVTVVLSGDTSAYRAPDIHVTVFPHLT
jgi:hypothetical protein